MIWIEALLVFCETEIHTEDAKVLEPKIEMHQASVDFLRDNRQNPLFQQFHHKMDKLLSWTSTLRRPQS
jgi:hypothetical protein